MKKKLWGLLVAMLAFLFIAGCGAEKKATAKTAKPEESIQTVNYQALTKDEKKNIEFKFKATNDSYGYAIDMVVKNDQKTEKPPIISKPYHPKQIEERPEAAPYPAIVI